MDKPTIFLSSTVFDFGDLRSALKDYLELRGCRVLASEFTDFTRPLEKHSYDACLETIEQADLFVLFIGRRIGGWYNEEEKISITRAEYQHAYNLAKKGTIRLMCFVRSEVYDHMDSVNDLEKTLKSDPALTEFQRKRFINHPSRAMEDAEAIISFIKEVTRNSETMAASKRLGIAPIANWIAPFTTFTQIRQAIDPLITHGLPVSQASGRKALELQLLQILQDIVPIVSGAPLNPIDTVLRLRKSLALNGDSYLGFSEINDATWNELKHIYTLTGNNVPDSEILRGFLVSGLLLKYDPCSGSFKETGESKLLSRVIMQADLFTRSGPPNLKQIRQYHNSLNADGSRTIPGIVLMSWLHRLLRWVDLIGTSRALASSLGGVTCSPFLLHS
ncbi:protein of unknown function [Sphingomonas sp. NFR04]|uniref:DUF4062 domain-containing protein n=1 Tax=Sphingomonas sp. NFR04 TaxID=1566283 RepID=UPI0008E4871B|nr:DUF4062 domain-containing protein [Sphingomonas sp. NFR04]SFJ96504.1 protein of unknown function [Sphingomonas sp. NFR04]